MITFCLEKTMLTKTRRNIKIGPHDHGRKMSLKAFEFAETAGGLPLRTLQGVYHRVRSRQLLSRFVVALIRNFLVAHQLAQP